MALLTYSYGRWSAGDDLLTETAVMMRMGLLVLLPPDFFEPLLNSKPRKPVGAKAGAMELTCLQDLL